MWETSWGLLALWFLVPPLESPLRRLVTGRPEYISPRGHQADYAPQLKVTSSSRRPTLHESLVLGFDNNSLPASLEATKVTSSRFLLHSCAIPCGFSSPYLYLCRVSLF